MTLAIELTTDPAGLGYAQRIAAGDHAGIVQLLNDPSQMAPKETWLTDRGLVSEIAPVHGIEMMDSIFGKFDQAALASPTVKNMVNRLHFDVNGLNFGDPALRGMFQAWSGNLMTVEEANALLAVSVAPASRAQILFGRQVSLTEVSEVLNNVG